MTPKTSNPYACSMPNDERRRCGGADGGCECFIPELLALCVRCTWAHMLVRTGVAVVRGRLCAASCAGNCASSGWAPTCAIGRCPLDGARHILFGFICHVQTYALAARRHCTSGRRHARRVCGSHDVAVSAYSASAAMSSASFVAVR